MLWLILLLVILLATDTRVLKEPSKNLLPQINVSFIMTIYSKIHLILIDSKMFFHLDAVSDATHRDILDETAHVFVTIVGSFIMNLNNVHTKMVHLDQEVVPGQLARQDHLQQIIPQQRKIDSPGRLNAI